MYKSELKNACITLSFVFCRQMLQHIRTIPEIILLGNSSPSLKRIPVFSFIVKHPRGTFLHHNFVSAILNDVFGIQARSGCPCSGSYAQDLLGIDQTLADQYENIILEDRYAYLFVCLCVFFFINKTNLPCFFCSTI